MTNFFVIATGTSNPHIKALGGVVEHVLKEKGIPCYRRAGTPESAWMVVDYLDVVVHIFSEETRDYYSLERLWGDAAEVSEEGEEHEPISSA